MECLTQCLGNSWWMVVLAFVAWWVLTALIDAVPVGWTFTLPGIGLVVPAGKIFHVILGNLFRAVRSVPGANAVLPQDPPPPGPAPTP